MAQDPRSPPQFVIPGHGAASLDEYMMLDRFRIRFSDQFDWLIPNELHSRLDVICATASDESHAPLANRVRQALNAPQLEVNLRNLVTPGDKVALAVDPHTPSLLAVVHELLRELVELNASMAESCIVLPVHAKSLAASLKSMMATEDGFDGVAIFLHDPSDRSALAYLGATAAGEPIYLARPLADADVVIPLFAAANEGIAQFLYRSFSGAPSEAPAKPGESRKRKPERPPPPSSLERDAEEAYWQLGVLFGVMVGSETGGMAGHIRAGAAAQLDQARTELQRAWECPAASPADLVIAEVSGGVDQQHWSAAAHALDRAREVATPEAMIVLVTDVPAGEMTRKAIRAFQRGSIANIENERSSEIAAFAAALGASPESQPIFLRSQMTEEATEELGIGFVSKPSELNRLIERRSRCVLIRDAQYVQFTSEAFATPPTSN